MESRGVEGNRGESRGIEGRPFLHLCWIKQQVPNVDGSRGDSLKISGSRLYACFDKFVMFLLDHVCFYMKPCVIHPLASFPYISILSLQICWKYSPTRPNLYMSRIFLLESDILSMSQFVSNMFLMFCFNI